MERTEPRHERVMSSIGRLLLALGQGGHEYSSRSGVSGKEGVQIGPGDSQASAPLGRLELPLKHPGPDRLRLHVRYRGRLLRREHARALAGEGTLQFLAHNEAQGFREGAFEG